jgi:hypothetical protein
LLHCVIRDDGARIDGHQGSLRPVECHVKSNGDRYPLRASSTPPRKRNRADFNVPGEFDPARALTSERRNRRAR